MTRTLRLGIRTLRASDARFRKIFEGAAVGMLVTDLEGRIVSVNRAIEEITGYGARELRGSPVTFLISNEGKSALMDALGALTRGEIATYRAERQVVTKDGESAWVRSSVSLTRKYGRPVNVIALCEDISEQKAACEQLRYQAKHDSLTGLANRGHFDEALRQKIDAAAATGSELALLYVDLDGLKLVNDTLGHAVGDSLLREAARRITACICPDELLARFGGDEFTILQTVGTSEPADSDSRRLAAAGLAEKIADALKSPLEVNQQLIHVGVTIGISRYPADGASPSALLQNADIAMYQAKRYNQTYRFFDVGMREAADRRLRIETQLRGAVEKGEFYLAFQPIYDARTDALLRFETLCRWRNEELGSVSPSEFIPIAEEIGLLDQIGANVLQQACAEASRWRHRSNSHIQIAVNVSPSQLRRQHFVDEIRDILRAASLPPELLEIEITESTFMDDPGESVAKLRQLRDMGVHVSIDDFGTGYSSLSCLHNVPAEALKIDRSFTARVNCDPAAVLMIRSVIALGHALGLRVITEGIEDERQLSLIRKFGSDEVQGHYLGMPESADAALQRVLQETA